MKSCLEVAPVIEAQESSASAESVLGEVIAGLRKPQKTLPSKLFYDDYGSNLFEQISQQPEYYPTRLELQITLANSKEIARTIGPRALLVEYGSGSCLKTRVLLENLIDPVGYVPIDISRALLYDTSRSLSADYPRIPIHPIVADYTCSIELPSFVDAQPSRIVAYFPGSTIGNFESRQALEFLRSIRKTCGRESALLIGVDLKKDPRLLHSAYNDAAGITEAFNLNLLRRLNREIRSDFRLETFSHYAFYNPTLSRVEMHLVSREQQSIQIGDSTIHFKEGESIHTEDCHKFTEESFTALAVEAGYKLSTIWTDPKRWFSVQYFTECV